MAPPSTPTPTPRRFLAPKRPATQSVTPKPLAGGTQQFQATPRFSLPSTPAPPPSAVFARQRRESISDIIDSSPPLQLLPPPPPPSRRFHDSIEVDSPPPSSPGPGSSPPGEDDAGPPWPKRRRLSASLPPARDDASVVSSIRDPSSPSEREDDDDDPDVPVPDAAEDPRDGPPAVGAPARAPPTQQQQQQPTFRPVPRFKPVDVPEGARHEPLPDVFSPRRRGEKFVPGGLAAGLRDWLMDLESATGAKRDGEWAARVFVEQVRASAGMRLVCARPVVESGGGGGHHRHPDEGTAAAAPPPPLPDALVPRTRLVLAGEGRLTGLARRNEVVVGSVLGIAKPLWEVGLGAEGRWLTACDWKVL